DTCTGRKVLAGKFWPESSDGKFRPESSDWKFWPVNCPEALVGMMLIAEAQDALRLPGTDPRRAVGLGSAIMSRAREASDHAAWSIAERALGVAALHTDDLDTSIRHLRTAIAHGRQAQARELVAQARMTLAFAMVSRGWTRRALRELDEALRHLRGLERARAQAQQ